MNNRLTPTAQYMQYTKSIDLAENLFNNYNNES